MTDEAVNPPKEKNNNKRLTRDATKEQNQPTYEVIFPTKIDFVTELNDNVRFIRSQKKKHESLYVDELKHLFKCEDMLYFAKGLKYRLNETERYLDQCKPKIIKTPDNNIPEDLAKNCTEIINNVSNNVSLMDPSYVILSNTSKCEDYKADEEYLRQPCIDYEYIKANVSVFFHNMFENLGRCLNRENFTYVDSGTYPTKCLCEPSDEDESFTEETIKNQEGYANESNSALESQVKTNSTENINDAKIYEINTNPYNFNSNNTNSSEIKSLVKRDIGNMNANLENSSSLHPATIGALAVFFACLIAGIIFMIRKKSRKNEECIKLIKQEVP